MLRSMLKARGVKTSEAQLLRFLEFVVQVCPWFPEEGTLNLETWEKVRERLQGYYDAHGPFKVPVDTFSLRNLVRDVIDPRHERIRYSDNEQPLLNIPQNDDPVPSVPPVSLHPQLHDEDDQLAPPEEEDLEKAAAHYHDPDEFVGVVQQAASADKPREEEKRSPLEAEVRRLQAALTSLSVQMQLVQAQRTGPLLESQSEWKPRLQLSSPSVIAGLDPQPEVPVAAPVTIRQVPGVIDHRSPLQKILQTASSVGEDVTEYGLTCPVIEQEAQGNPVRVHVPFAFKSLKELKTACAQYGPNAPFTQALLDSLAADALSPSDWKQLARACLSGGEYLLWNSDFAVF